MAEVDMTDEQLRSALKKYMGDVPPVTGTTRKLLIKRLEKFREKDKMQDDNIVTIKSTTIETSAKDASVSAQGDAVLVSPIKSRRMQELTNERKSANVSPVKQVTQRSQTPKKPISSQPSEPSPKKSKSTQSTRSENASPNKSRQDMVGQFSPKNAVFMPMGHEDEQFIEQPLNTSTAKVSQQSSFTSPIPSSMNRDSPEYKIRSQQQQNDSSASPSNISSGNIEYDLDGCRVRRFPATDLPNGVTSFGRRSISRTYTDPYKEIVIKSPAVAARNDASRIFDRVLMKSESKSPSAWSSWANRCRRPFADEDDYSYRPVHYRRRQYTENSFNMGKYFASIVSCIVSILMFPLSVCKKLFPFLQDSIGIIINHAASPKIAIFLLFVISVISLVCLLFKWDPFYNSPAKDLASMFLAENPSAPKMVGRN